jgi:hypothetical protein
MTYAHTSVHICCFRIESAKTAGTMRVYVTLVPIWRGVRPSKIIDECLRFFPGHAFCLMNLLTTKVYKVPYHA